MTNAFSGKNDGNCNIKTSKHISTRETTRPGKFFDVFNTASVTCIAIAILKLLSTLQHARLLDLVDFWVPLTLH